MNEVKIAAKHKSGTLLKRDSERAGCLFASEMANVRCAVGTSKFSHGCGGSSPPNSPSVLGSPCNLPGTRDVVLDFTGGTRASNLLFICYLQVVSRVCKFPLIVVIGFSNCSFRYFLINSDVWYRMSA